MKNYSLKINGHNYDVSIDETKSKSNVLSVAVNGTEYDVEIENGDSQVSKAPHVSPAPASTGLSVASGPAAPISQGAPQGGANSVTSPLPGTVLSIKVKVGDQVQAGQSVVVLEAMKMENSIYASKTGTVKSIPVSQGATVAEGEVLMVIE